MQTQYLKRKGKPDLAYIHTPAAENGQSLPLVMFLGGYRSDMSGTKATYFEEQCKARGQAYLRFDYSGHGQSGGAFEDGTIGSWAADALDVLDHVAEGPVLLVGSSMGGWIALLVARQRPEITHGLIGIAAAPDFTEEIYHERLDDAQRRVLMEQGKVLVENDYSDEPYAYTKAFYEDGKANLLLNKSQSAAHPIRLIQGKQDKDVPWQTAVKIAEVYAGSDIDVIFVEDGDHRLSRPQDLALIDQQILMASGA